jgi:4-hydroxybenzoate polyprenyltransferase
MRLQFYPMTWLAYSLGAAVAPVEPFRAPVYWAGIAVLVLLEMATVFTNELVDYETDRRNRHAGPFNGGSRVLVEGRLTVRALRYSAGLAVIGAVLATAGTAALAPPGSAAAAIALVIVFGAIALGYTLPPALVYRGAGEFTVAATHSTGPLLLGYVLQGGALFAPAPWLLSLPLLLAILPSITLAGIPDAPSDASVGKRTLAVRRGSAYTAGAALVQTAAAAVAAGAVSLLLGPVYGFGGLIILAHGALLIAMVQRYRHAGAPTERIDGLMIAALTYLAWFTLLPLLTFVA